MAMTKFNGSYKVKAKVEIGWLEAMWRCSTVSEREVELKPNVTKRKRLDGSFLSLHQLRGSVPG